mmetsp:Transcript_23955/g.24193  ORF Transcript_23955/g.24193 Transcript_23955/m.24193 type:complete len:280 (+) Transcript_23955:192-1031(+)
MTTNSSKRVSITLSSPEEGRELFLLKFQEEVTREKCNELMRQFKAYNICMNPCGSITVNEAMLLFEDRGEAKTATELKNDMTAIGVNSNEKTLNFLQYLCILYKKKYDEVNSFPSDEAKSMTLAEAKAAFDAAARIEEEMLQAKLAKEAEDKKKAEELEKESRLTGVLGMAAFFNRQIQRVTDSSLTNEQLITREAARRKALREAKQKQQEAEEVLKRGEGPSAAEVLEEVRDRRRIVSMEHAAAVARRQKEEREARAQRKAELNAKWSQVPQTPVKSA